MDFHLWIIILKRNFHGVGCLIIFKYCFKQPFFNTNLQVGWIIDVVFIVRLNPYWDLSQYLMLNFVNLLIQCDAYNELLTIGGEAVLTIQNILEIETIKVIDSGYYNSYVIEWPKCFDNEDNKKIRSFGNKILFVNFESEKCYFFMSKKSVQVEVECIKNRHQEFKEIKFSSVSCDKHLVKKLEINLIDEKKTRHFYGCFNDPCTTWGPSCNFQLIVFIFFLLFDQVSASTSNDSLIFTFGILLCVLVMIFLFIVCYFLTFRLKPSTCKQNNQRQRTIYHDEEMAIDKTQSSLEIEHIDENIDENMPESNLQIETEEPNVELKLFDYEKAEYYENENSSSGSDVEDKELRVGMCTCRDAAVSYDMDDSISEFKTYLMKDGVRIKSAYFANESKESGNLNKDLPIGVFPLLAVGASGGKYHGVVHSVSVGVSSQPIAEQFFAPGAPEDLRASAFDALSFSEKFCRDNGIEFTKYEKDCYFYEFDPPQDDRKGPSAGIPLTIATLSKITNKLPDKDLCSTGQIRITGLMLSVDGLKFKVRAAKAVGKTKILLPKEMESKYNKLKEKDKNGMTAIFAEYFDINTYNEVFQIVPVTPSPQVNDIN